VRGNDHGQLRLLSYGMLSACNLSPIEIKPFYHFWPGSRHLSLGSVGCNFRCAGCQNWEIACTSNTQHATLRQLSAEQVTELALAVEADGVSFTYNEPTVWLEYVVDCAQVAKGEGLLTDLVTNGYQTEEALRTLATHIDAIRIDVKGNQASYDAITSGIRAAHVRNNAEAAQSLGLHLELVTNLIPQVSDSAEVLADIAAWIADKLGPDTPWHLTRFHPARKLSQHPRTELQALERGLEIAREHGLRFVYLGNVPGHRAESTWCPKCGGLLIARTGWGVTEVRLDGDRCRGCQQQIPLTGNAHVSVGGPHAPRPIV
jgi:pyruvate formate lyase activating enzyme